MSKRNLRVGFMTAFLVVLLTGAGPAAAQGFFEEYDPLVIIPEVLVIIDTSGSMTSGGYTCGDGNFPCDRRRAVREVLTGTYLANPPALGCPDQLNDGILDEYQGQLRIGFASFDNDRTSCTADRGTNVYNYPNSGSGDTTAAGGLLGIKNRTDLGGALVDVVDPANPNALTLNSDRVQMAACMTDAYGCTPLNAALSDALYYYNNFHTEIDYTDPISHCRPKYVLLMTDGQNNGTTAYYGTPEQEAANLFDAGITVFVVGFGGGLEAWVDPIAQAGSGGALNAFTADNPDELRTQFEVIFQAILAGAGTRTDVASAPSLFNYGRSYVYKAGFQISNSWLGWQGALFRYKVEDTDLDGEPELDMANPLAYHTILEATDPNQRKIYTIVHNPRRPGPLYEFRPSNDDVDPLMCLGDRRERRCTATADVQICETWDVTQGPCIRYANKTCNSDADCSTYPCTDLECKECSASTNKACATDADCNQYACIALECKVCTATDPGTGSCITWDYEQDCTAWNAEQICAQYDYVEVCVSWETRTECTAWDDIGDVADLADTVKEYVRGVPGTEARGGGFEMPGPMLGDIFHSNPTVVPPPSALNNDFKYETFWRRYYNRDTMVYVGANDGMLHAFVGEDNNLSDGNREGQELWAFIPNNLLAKIQKVRWGHYFFVDGTPVVRDVYFNNIQAVDLDGKPMEVGGKKVMGAYRSVLISGERRGGSAYFALDVSNPDDPQYLWEYRTNVLPFMDYGENQCKESVLETRAKPIVGSVWLKRTNPEPNEDAYVAKSVAILPDGYVDTPNLMSVNSCVEFVELVMGATSFNIVDVENGKLLRKFSFTGSGNAQANLDGLEDFYTKLADGYTGDWGWTFKSDDFSGLGNCGPAWGTEGMPSAGWCCTEDRPDIRQAPYVPPEQMSSCTVAEDSDTKYVLHCCCRYDGATGECNQEVNCNPNAVTNCLYEYTKYKNVDGGLVLKKKGNCQTSGGKNNMVLRIAEDFGIESVSGTPAAYDTTAGEFLTRIFIPTSKGRIWRVDVGNGLYDKTAPEGQMVGAYTVGGFTYDWDVTRDTSGNAVPFFDVSTSAVECVGRPITVTPTLALNYNHELTLFFGTGNAEQTEWADTTDCFYAVKESVIQAANGDYLLSDQGELFGTPGVMNFGPAERLYHKPLVAAGKVVLATYTPDEDLCEPGVGKYYAYPFAELVPSEQILTPGANDTVGPPPAPQMVWTAAGPQVAKGITDTGLSKLGDNLSEAMSSAAHVLHWASVL